MLFTNSKSFSQLKSIEYRPEIDGLRALAVMPVVFFHAGIAAFPGGFIGVDVFFVISGYLISNIILDELDRDQFSLFRFYERRARRILPALFFVTVTCIPLGWLWLLPEDLDDFFDSIAAVSLFSSNIFFWMTSSYFSSAAELKPLLHTWSLAIEEQFYIFYPLFLLFFWKRNKWLSAALLAVAFLTSISLAHWGSGRMPSATFFLLPMRGWELIAGCFSALFLRYHTLNQKHLVSQLGSLLGLGLIVFSIFFFDEKLPHPSFWTLIPVSGTVLFIMCADRRTWCNKLFRLTPIVFLGLLSYSIYLWHQPLFVFARHFRVEEPRIEVMLSLSALSIFLGYLSWRFVEQPFRKKDKFGQTRIFAFSVLALAAMFSLGLLGSWGDGFHGRYSKKQLVNIYLRDAHLEERDDGGCHLDKDMYHPSNCIWGDFSVAPRYALIGDSHASTLVKTLDQRMGKLGSSFVQYTKNACPFSLDATTEEVRNCDLFFWSVLDDLESREIHTLVLYSRWSYYLHDSDYSNQMGGIEHRIEKFSVTGVSREASIEIRSASILDSYQSLIEKILAKGNTIILVSPTPEHGWDIPKRFVRYGEVPSLPLSTYDERHQKMQSLISSFESDSQFNLVDSRKILCSLDIESCPTHLNGDSLYYDDDHLSNSGAELLAEDLLRFVTHSKR